MKNLRDSLPSWIDSERAGAVGSLKVCLQINLTVAISFIWDIFFFTFFENYKGLESSRLLVYRCNVSKECVGLT